MKTLKFREELSKLILKNEKKTTWRLFDDKNLSVGDEVTFLVYGTLEEFARARITAVHETSFGSLTDEDWDGHEKYDSEAEMYATFSGYYGRKVDANSPVKVIRFEFL